MYTVATEMEKCTYHAQNQSYMSLSDLLLKEFFQLTNLFDIHVSHMQLCEIFCQMRTAIRACTWDELDQSAKLFFIIYNHNRWGNSIQNSYRWQACLWIRKLNSRDAAVGWLSFNSRSKGSKPGVSSCSGYHILCAGLHCLLKHATLH